MSMNTGFLVAFGCLFLLMKQTGGRSVGESVGVNFPDQASYQEYAGEQQEYVDPPGEAERQVRNAQDDGNQYQPKENIRDVRANGAEEANTNVADIGYQARISGEDEDMGRPQGNKVALDRRVMDMQVVKKDDETAEGEVVEQRDEESLRPGNVEQNDAAGDTAAFRRPRDNQDEEGAKTEMGRPEGDAAVAADVGYDAANEPAVAQMKENAAYTGAETNYNYNYVQEPENMDAVEGGVPGAIGGNEEGAPPSQYEQASN